VQSRPLHLRPWEAPPCITSAVLACRACHDPDDKSCGRMPDEKEIALLNRMRAAGLSIYEPDPLGALAAIEQAERAAG
jgi:hypothetical protein